MRDLQLLRRAGANIDSAILSARAKGLCCWHGMQVPKGDTLGVLGCGTTASNRVAQTMSPKLQILVDNYFIGRFGWAARTVNVLFVTGSRHWAESFGTVVACHPLGATRCIWSSQIHDLASDLNERFGTSSSLNEDNVVRYLDEARYIEGDLEDALRSGNEVMLHSERFVWTRPDDPLFLASPPVTEEMLWYEKLYEGIVGGRWVRHECWNWDGIRGQSMLFHREDVWDAPDQVLVAIVNDVLTRPKKSLEIGGVSVPFTITRDLTMVFVNWGFQVA